MMLFGDQRAFEYFIQQTRAEALECPHKAHVVELLWPYFQKLEKELYPNPRDRAQNKIIDKMVDFLAPLNSGNYLDYLSLYPHKDNRRFLTKIKYFMIAQLLWHISRTSEEDLFPSKIDQIITEPSYCSFEGIPLVIYNNEGESMVANTIEQILAIPRGRRQHTDGIKCLQQVKDYLNIQSHLPGFFERLFRKRLSSIRDWAQHPTIEAAYRKKSEEDKRQVLMSVDSWCAFVNETRTVMLRYR